MKNKKLVVIILAWIIIVASANAVYNNSEQIMTKSSAILNSISSSISSDVEPTPTPTPVITYTSSTSTGGQGVSTNEPYDNIECQDKLIKDWYFNLTSTYLFRSCDEFDVLINSKVNEFYVTVKIETLKSKSVNTPKEPSGHVYKYFNLYAGSQRFKDAIIKFRIEPTWVSTMDSVVLQRWNGNDWNILETTQIGLTDVWISYEAHTDAFSNFAIVGKQVSVPQLVATSETVVETPIETLTITSVETSEQPKSDFNGTVAIVFVLIVLGVVYLFLRKK